VATLMRMPAIAAGAETAILSEWQVQEGVPFEQADTIATIETDKALLDMEADEPGVIVRFLISEGAVVEVGAAIALRSAPGETVDDIDGALRGLGVAGQPLVPDEPPPSAGPTSQPEAASAEDHSTADNGSPGPAHAASNERLFATPLVRRLAREASLDLSRVAGTGPNGRIVRRDIDAVLTEPAPPQRAPAPDNAGRPMPAVVPGPAETGFEDIPHTRIRAAIAARLTASKHTVPHFYLRGSCRVDRLLALRAELNAEAEHIGKTKVSVNDLVVKAAARAHALVPTMNVVWTEHAVRRFDTVDIAVAVASRRGLVTPVVRDVSRRSIITVSADLADLAERARLGKLAQHEIEGGAFCISNLGMYGTEEFSAIINPPQSAILAVGAALSKPVVEAGELAVATVMQVTLSVDHRPIDGSIAAEWMRAFVGIVENPVQILL